MKAELEMGSNFLTKSSSAGREHYRNKTIKYYYVNETMTHRKKPITMIGV